MISADTTLGRRPAGWFLKGPPPRAPKGRGGFQQAHYREPQAAGGFQQAHHQEPQAAAWQPALHGLSHALAGGDLQSLLQPAAEPGIAAWEPGPI